MPTILLIILILLMVGFFPTWSHSANWGYFPSGSVGLVVLVIVVLMIAGWV